MKDFANLNNSSGSFPNVVGVDASGPGETDGTELTADLFNDIMGAFQALLNEIGATPSGTAESGSGTSQILDAIKNLGNKTPYNWFSRTPDASYAGEFKSSATDGNIIVIVGDSGEIQYSYDGIYWVSNTQGASAFNAVYYNGTHWVAVGASGTLYYATDPTGSWTSNTQGADTLCSIYNDGTYWVIVGNNSSIYISKDPTSSFELISYNHAGGADYNNVNIGIYFFILCGDVGTILTSLRYK